MGSFSSPIYIHYIYTKRFITHMIFSEVANIHISGQIIIFHHPGFPWNKKFPLLNHHLGEIGRGNRSRANLTRYIIPLNMLRDIWMLTSNHGAFKKVRKIKKKKTSSNFPKNNPQWANLDRGKLIQTNVFSKKCTKLKNRRSDSCPDESVYFVVLSRWSGCLFVASDESCWICEQWKKPKGWLGYIGDEVHYPVI